MQVLIVYDSVFGNTRRIAAAIGKAIASKDDVKTIPVDEFKSGDLTGVGLLIVGSPTRAFKPTRAIQNFLKGIPSKGLKSIRVAAFDTRISTTDINSRFLNILVKLFGYAAQPIADRLQKKGGIPTVPAEGFIVKDTEGPLKEGEPGRAADWAQTVQEKL